MWKTPSNSWQSPKCGTWTGAASPLPLKPNGRLARRKARCHPSEPRLVPRVIISGYLIALGFEPEGMVYRPFPPACLGTATPALGRQLARALTSSALEGAKSRRSVLPARAPRLAQKPAAGSFGVRHARPESVKRAGRPDRRSRRMGKARILISGAPSTSTSQMMSTELAAGS